MSDSNSNAAPTNITIGEARIADAREDVATAEAQLVKAQARVDARKAALAALENAEANAAELAGIDKGYTVTFDFGRGDKRRTITGTVIAAGDDKGERVLVVSYGSGLDVNTARVKASDITDYAAP